MMSFSYKKLWKLVIDRDLNKTQLRERVGISSATLAKLSKNEKVSLNAIAKICKALECDIGDIVEYVKEVKVDTKTMNVIDLFSGAGGLSYGFEMAGFNVLLGIDNDEAALNTFKLNHNESKILKCDITSISYKSDIKPLIGDRNIDVIVGGPPCQGMSISGPRKFDDPRNGLYLSYIRLVKEIMPKAFVIENVSGIVSLFKGRIKDHIIDELTKIGYKVQFKTLIASDYGVPQNRKRVIFVGTLEDGFSYPEPVGDTITTKMAISDLPRLEYELGDTESDYLTPPQNEYQKLMRCYSQKVYNHVAANHSDRVKEIIALVPDGGNYKSLPEELRETRKFNVAWTRFPSDKPSPTIDTGHRHHFHYKFNRVPTVRESARLQSFPDNFIFTGNKTQQFRQVGNAVPPILAKIIADKLLDYLLATTD